MPGRHQQRREPRHQQRRGSARWLLGAAGVLLAGSIVAAVSPAEAASSTTNAQLSLSGVATPDSPTGGSVVGIHPGDKVVFKASTAPTAGLDKLGLGGLIGSLLDGAASYQVTADFSNLPGGSKNTVLSGSQTKSFTFNNKGTYSFTWTAQSVTVLPVVGKQVTQIQLNGNQLKSKGIALNANNQYVGKVVVAVDPPQGGIGIQIPSVGAHPSVTHVGNLPSVGVPGVNLPTIHTSVPNLLPTGGKTKPSSGGGATTKGGGGGINYTPPAQGVPERVVPSGDTGAVYPGAGGGGGVIAGQQGTDGGVTTGQLPVANTVPVNGDGVHSSSAAPTAKAKRVDLASSDPSPSGQIPVLLAILAIIALAVVAGTYARLYLLRRT